jgi:Predicted P-loop ATPase and inactivated derivatives
MTRELLGEYCRAGLVLVPIPTGLKSPVMKGWQERARCITDPEIAEFLDGNVGLAHAYSGTVCLDIDDMEKAADFFADKGVDLATWLNAPDAVGITSGRPGRAKLLYRGPVLPTFNCKPLGFELRCGNNRGTTMQDVLPPSIHPDTGKPYEWAGYGDWRKIPEMPPELLTLWQSMVKPDSKIPRERRETRMPFTELADKVAQHDPDADYDSWVRVGMAIHYETDGEDEGLELWDQWSSTGAKYKGIDDLASHWRSFRVDGDNPVTGNSLRIDTAAGSDEFRVITQDEVDAAVRQSAVVAVVPGTIGGKLKVSADTAAQLAKLDRDKAGYAYATLPNVLTVLEMPEISQSKICFDDFKSELMIATADSPEVWRPIRDTDYTAARLWLENEALFHPVSKELVRDTVHYIGEANKMDSAQEWLLSLKWDGVERIKDFMPRYMGTLDAAYERSVGVYLWTALAGRVMEPGCQADMCPILVGRQGVGKSRGIQALVPDPSFYVEIRLDEDDDEIARKMRGVLIGEIAELRGLRTSDADRIKAFVTRTHEKWTPKYMEHSHTFSRRLIMIGSTNEDEFLSDSENRRWLPVRTTGVNVDAIKRDMEQLWAEAYELWLSGGVLWHQAETLSKEQRSEFEADDNWQPTVQAWLDETKAPHYTTADILTLAVGLDSRNVSKTHEMRLGSLMRKLGYMRFQKRINGKSTKVWVVDNSVADLLA